MTKQNRNTKWFIGFLLLAGLANMTGRFLPPAWDALFNCIQYMTYTGLLIFWLETVRVRLLPSRARTYITGMAGFMILYMLLRFFKYRFAFTLPAMHYANYSYWIPQLMIPTLFLMTAVCIRHRNSSSGTMKEPLLLIPAVFLSAIVMTNDLHQFVYVRHMEQAEYIITPGTYGYGPGFVLLYAWMISALITGLVLLSREVKRLPGKAIKQFILVLVLWIGLILLNILVINKLPIRIYNDPEIHIFCMLAVSEICIRNRMIPYNENYAGFFGALKMPVLITDRNLQPAYASGETLSVEKDVLKAAVSEPVILNDDWKLSGKEISAGYAFWAEDESGIYRAQERLQEANETIEQENDLLRAETEQKEKDAYLTSRHRIYHEIAEKLYPTQQKITGILNTALPGTEEFKDKIKTVSVLNAYVKRKTNLLLLEAENTILSLTDLFLALQESSNYLTLAGLHTTAAEAEEKDLPAGILITLYDSFEIIAEQLIGKAPSLMVSWTGNGLRLVAEAGETPDTQEISLPVVIYNSEGILYMDILAGKDGESL